MAMASGLSTWTAKLKIAAGFLFLMTVQSGVASIASAQITTPTNRSYGGTQTVSLEDQLINRLKATTEDRQAYIRLVVQQVDAGNIDKGRVLAFERYAIRKNPHFPFPFFERAMRAEADRLDIYLPPVKLLAGVSFQRD
jgi:hypothetical protein